MKINTKKVQQNFWGYFFVFPNIVGLLLFTVGPILAAVYFSFTEYSILQAPTWIGLENFKRLFADRLMWKSLKNTFYFAALYVPLQTFSALLVAVLLNQVTKGVKFFRTAFFIPTICSWITVSLVWKWLLDPEAGWANSILEMFSIPKSLWLFDERLVIPLLALIAVWKGIGYMMVIFLAALQGVPKELYEAAEIDGANMRDRFWHITFPAVSPITMLVLLMSMIWAFQSFEQIYVMTSGGPENASLVTTLYLYNNAFNWYHMGYAASISWVLFLILLILMLMQMYLEKYWVKY
jgi:multiple sugar transport system permease protein